MWGEPGLGSFKLSQKENLSAERREQILARSPQNWLGGCNSPSGEQPKPLLPHSSCFYSTALGDKNCKPHNEPVLGQPSMIKVKQPQKDTLVDRPTDRPSSTAAARDLAQALKRPLGMPGMPGMPCDLDRLKPGSCNESFAQASISRTATNIESRGPYRSTQPPVTQTPCHKHTSPQ